MMGDGPVWEPSTEKEATYYDKLFRVVDRDESGTLDGKEAVQFLAHSGLTKAQLKDVWSVSNSPGQTVLQRQEFYVAMRAVALTQSGEASLTRQKIRETSIKPITMPTFKGMPAPPMKLSKGKKPQATKKTKEPSKAPSKKVADSVGATAAPKKAAKTGDTGKFSRASGDGSDTARTNRGDTKRGESGHARSDSDGSSEGEKSHRKRSSRVGVGDHDSGDEDKEQGSDSEKSSSSSSSGSSASSTGSSHSLDRGDGDDGGGSASMAGNDGIRSRSSSSSSASSSSSSSSEEAGTDPFTMSEKARARYQAIFSKVDASGEGSLSGKQVVGLCVKSGLDKAVLGTIWSLWPAGYVPPSVLARRKEEEERKRHKEEEERRRKEQLTSGETLKTGADATAVDTTKKKRQTRRKDGAGEGGNKAAGGLSGNKKAREEREEEERKEKTSREAASLQKKEELAKKRAEKIAKNKNKRSRTGNNLLASAAASNSPMAGKEAHPLPRTTAELTNAETEQSSKDEGAPRADDANTLAAAAVAASSPQSDAGCAPSSVGDGGEGAVNCGAPQMKKKKKKRPQSPASDAPSSMAGISDVEGGGATGARETAEAVGPLTMAERRARKAEARAAKIEAARLKKEAEARDARIAELDQQDASKTFTIKAMDPMKTSEDNGAIHMLSDPSGGGDGGPLSFARLSAPLPYLTPHPGRPPCLQLQEFSVSFPSGVRRASSLTSSLDIRLGPPPAPPQQATDLEGESDVGASLIRCPECAEFLARDQIVQHIRSTCRLLPCTLCSRLVLPADRERHLEEVCPNRRRSCTRCGEAIILSEFARHEKEGGCPCRVVPCAACGAFCYADELTGHEVAECPERGVCCPSCGDTLPARLMAEHASSLCRSTTWTCGCGEGPIRLVDRPGHLRTCDAFIDAWEASIEKVITRMPKIEVIRNIGKVMIATRVENPGIALLALAESKGVASLAARRMNDSKSYINEICLAADIINVEVFLKALKKPGKRGAGALWRTGM
eukprot:g13857.t1